MKYILWNNIKINNNLYVHPNTWDYWNESGQGILTETAFSDGNGLYIGLLDNLTIPAVDLNFHIEEKTESEINALLLEWYGTDEQGNQYITVSNFEFTDSRPIEI